MNSSPRTPRNESASPLIGDDIRRAVAALRAGRLVAFATETVYGLGADAANPSAIAALYRLKRRPLTHPLIVHIPELAALRDWADAPPPAALALARRFMPGALTLLLPRAAHVLPAVCGGGDYVALRLPAHPLARRLLSAFGGGIAAPSANRFGGISPTTAAHVAAEFPRSALYILDGGACRIGIESTIVGFCDGRPYILRPGGVAAAAVAAIAGELVAPPPDVRAPGTHARHYAPQTPLRLADTAAIAAAARPPQAVLSVRRPPSVVAEYWRRASTSPRVYAKNLYRYLRELDALAAPEILVERPPQTEDWRAVNDRLLRAAQK